MTYNNPVFLDQCKNKGIKVADIDKGWVPQNKLVDDSKEEDIFDDEEDDFDDEEDDFNENENSNISFKFGDKKRSISTSNSSNKNTLHKFNYHKNDTDKQEYDVHKEDRKDLDHSEEKDYRHDTEDQNLSMKDLEEKFSERHTYTRDKVEDAFSDIKPKIKLNIDKSDNFDKSDKKESKPVIKLKFKE